MAGVTQLIPNYVLGISEQPDELKMPGQVVDLKNGLPDVTRGLIKRPGSELVSSITPNSGTLSWFNIYTDSDTQYIGNVSTSGVIQIWRTSDGAVIPIDYSGVTGTNACTYLTGWTNNTDLQPLTVNETTFMANRTKTVAMKTGTSDKSPAAVHEAVVTLKTISYGKQYALDIFDPTSTATTTDSRATSVEVAKKSGDTYWNAPTGNDNDGSCTMMGRSIHTATSFASSPSGKANIRVELDVRCQPVVDPANAGGGDSDTINAVQYNDSYQPYMKLQFGGEGWTTGDTFDVTTEKGISVRGKVKSHVTLTSRANLAKVRPAATSSSADEAVTAAGILGDMKTKLDAVKPSGMTCKIVGTSLHITHTSAFNVTTPEPQLMSIIGNEANTVGDLPPNCRHNYVVRIANSSEQEDDFYLKFKANNVLSSNTATNIFGLGVWEECPKPSLEIKFDQETMPIKLVRENPSGSYSNGRFLVQNPTWEDRLVGDDITNPTPTFVGYKINKLVFFRNRLVILSEENCITSATNDFFNFWSATAQAVNDDDPIDLQSSSIFPTTLYDAIEVNSGLLIFSSNQQFMLTTDSDAFTPKTAKINYLSSYNFNHLTRPFSLGTTSGFINSTGNNARFYEMADIRREGEPVILEQSKVVSKLLPPEIDQAAPSKENGVILFGATNKSEVWGYRYFNTEARRVQSAWFRWELPGTVTYHTIMDDVYYTILKNGSNYTLEAFDVKEQDTTFTVGTAPEEYIIHLDTHSTVSSLSSSAYNTTTKLTTFTKPTGYNNSAKQLAVYDNNTGNNIGRYDLATVSGSNLTVPGDWTGVNFVLGYQYDWEVELPVIYPVKQEGDKTRSDTRASLIVHRLNLSFGSVGLIDVTLKRKGRADYTQSAESANWGTYLASRLPIATEYIHTIPAYERNTNLNVTLKSSNPFPSSLHSMNWEGDYSNKFYRRV